MRDLGFYIDSKRLEDKFQITVYNLFEKSSLDPVRKCDELFGLNLEDYATILSCLDTNLLSSMNLFEIVNVKISSQKITEQSLVNTTEQLVNVKTLKSMLISTMRRI